jgi:flagellum-specific peptidoglycan hydrolase FlgJ
MPNLQIPSGQNPQLKVAGSAKAPAQPQQQTPAEAKSAPASLHPTDKLAAGAIAGAVAGGAAASLSLLGDADATQHLKDMKPAELKHLGKTDKKAFFAALLPAALESERKYGVPAEVTLAQAALESGWARSAIGGYNVFGIKGSGPAGTVSLATTEGSGTASKAKFAKFNNFHEAVGEHGKMFNNGSYAKGMKAYAKDANPLKFVDNIAAAYATAPNYASQVKSIITKYGLQNMAAQARRAAD